jgi:hypothetical protein
MLRAAMPAYRLYPLKDDGHVAGPPAVVECPDDQAAIEHARQVAIEQPVEIWLLDRRILRVDPNARAS